jgi:hypothetical protein
MPSTPDPICDITAVIHDHDRLLDLFEKLQTIGIHRADIGLIGRDIDVEDHLSSLYDKVGSSGDDRDMLPGDDMFIQKSELGDAQGMVISTLAYIGALGGQVAVVAGGGGIPMAVAALAGGGIGGAGLGSLLAGVIEELYADKIEKSVDNGGILLTIRPRAEDLANKAEEVLNNSKARHIKRHPIEN